MSKVIFSIIDHDCDELHVTAAKSPQLVGNRRNAKGFTRTLKRLELKMRPTRHTDDMI
jgi:hypothetical protein